MSDVDLARRGSTKVTFNTMVESCDELGVVDFLLVEGEL